MNIREISKQIKKLAKDDLKDKIIKFFKDNPNPKDDKVHEFADKNNIDPHELESEIYAILSDYIENGTSVENWEGIGKDLTEKDVDASELKMGIQVEYEHTSNKEIASRIARDHLKEIPDYYTRLKKMESEAENK